MMGASESVEFQQQAERLKTELTVIGEDVARALIASGLPPAECEPVIVAMAKRVQKMEAFVTAYRDLRAAEDRDEEDHVFEDYEPCDACGAIAAASDRLRAAWMEMER